MSVGEKDNLVATHAKTFTGNATLYNAVWDDANMKWVKGSEVIGIAEFSNGVATIPFPSLSKGTFYFIVNITDWIPKYDDDLVTVEVKENTPEISANVSASEITYGETIVVKMSGGTFGTRAEITIDEFDWYDPIFDENGNLTKAFPDLAVGTHKIKIQYGYNDKFYSNSFYITVKEVPAPAPAPAPGPAPQGQTSTPAKNDVVKLTLKKVKVKKSAKKLVLQATLKINGKAVKGKVIKFKFNKKTYKAKTNKKGVAKVTIKKSVLKKLKAGKKVTYQATYDKTTVKKTVKVKK